MSINSYTFTSTMQPYSTAWLIDVLLPFCSIPILMTPPCGMESPVPPSSTLVHTSLFPTTTYHDLQLNHQQRAVRLISLMVNRLCWVAVASA